jgi:hypothetical protein
MAINFIPNDPDTQTVLPTRRQAAHPDRPAGRASFRLVEHNGQAPFEFGTTDFLFWQSREAALAAVDAWEQFAGNLTRWADRSEDPTQIDLSPVFDDGQTLGPQRLNAFYDGTGVRFFDFNDGKETTFSGNSTDTVSHEVGHALLDSVRPELFGSMFPEVAAFHEAFGDCTAILTALADQPTRAALLAASPDLGAANFVEATSEYLSAAVRRQFGNVAPSLPRRALNNDNWQLPSTLPAGRFEDPPELLSREPHSFSRVFTGCFYDVLRGIFTAAPDRSEAALATAAKIAGALLVAAVRATPETARYFQAVGRAMVVVDQRLHGGTNRALIGAAFARHAVMLGSSAMTAPTAALAGAAPRIAAAAALDAATVDDLRERIRARKGAAFAVRPVPMLGQGIVEAVHRREVPLGDVDNRLEGVVAYANEPMLIGSSGGRAAVLGALPEPNRTADEVTAFVETLVKHGRIAFTAPAPRTAAAAAAPERAARQPYTHIVRRENRKRVLTRIRFLC